MSTTITYCGDDENLPSLLKAVWQPCVEQRGYKAGSLCSCWKQIDLVYREAIKWLKPDIEIIERLGYDTMASLGDQLDFYSTARTHGETYIRVKVNTYNGQCVTIFLTLAQVKGTGCRRSIALMRAICLACSPSRIQRALVIYGLSGTAKYPQIGPQMEIMPQKIKSHRHPANPAVPFMPR